MADNELAPDAEPDTADAPEGEARQPENTNADSADDAAQPPSVEAIAAELGWSDKDKWRGDPDAWKPADEFLRETGKITKHQSKELKRLSSQMENMTRTAGTLLEQQLAERDAFWEARRNEAIENGDREAVDHADKQRQALRQQTQPSNDADVEAWIGENPWFRTDPIAAQAAWAVCQQNANRPVSEQLELAKREVHKRFPEYAPQQQRPAPAVNRPGSRSAGGGNRKKGFHDLPAEAQAVARDMHERLGIPTETYVSNYFKQEGAVG